MSNTQRRKIKRVQDLAQELMTGCDLDGAVWLCHSSKLGGVHMETHGGELMEIMKLYAIGLARLYIENINGRDKDAPTFEEFMLTLGEMTQMVHDTNKQYAMERVRVQ